MVQVSASAVRLDDCACDGGIFQFVRLLSNQVDLYGTVISQVIACPVDSLLDRMKAFLVVVLVVNIGGRTLAEP